MMTALVCWLNHLLKIITSWYEMLNEHSFLMITQVCMHMSLSFVWSSIILWTFSQVSLWVILFSDFMCSSRSYHLIWSHTWAFILCSRDILVTLEHRAFHFIASQSTCSFNQQSYSCQSVAIILSWNHVHQFQFMIQIQFMSSVHKSHRTESHSLTHSLCCSW